MAVAEAAVVGKRVMAHAMSPAGIRNALIAGVTSIEHGCLLDEEGIALMKEKGAYLVPTLVAPGDVIAGARDRRWAAGRDDREGGANPRPASRSRLGGDRLRREGRDGDRRGGGAARQESPRTRLRWSAAA